MIFGIEISRVCEELIKVDKLEEWFMEGMLKERESGLLLERSDTRKY